MDGGPWQAKLLRHRRWTRRAWDDPKKQPVECCATLPEATSKQRASCCCLESDVELVGVGKGYASYRKSHRGESLEV